MGETAERPYRLRERRRQRRGQSRNWLDGLNHGSRRKCGVCGGRRKVEIHSEQAQQQKRHCEQHRTSDCEPCIVAMLTKETSHVSPIGA